MSVLSCRFVCSFLSDKIFKSDFWFSVSGIEVRALFLAKNIGILVFPICLTACASAPPTYNMFRTPGINSAQWSRIQDECWYEAEKATAAADPRTAVSYTKRQLFNMCAKLKGATFIGTITMPEAQWKRISTLCKEESAKAVAGQPASKARDEREEDIEFECEKRNGVVFEEAL